MKDRLRMKKTHHIDKDIKQQNKKKLDEMTKKVVNFKVKPTKPITNKSLKKVSGKN